MMMTLHFGDVFLPRVPLLIFFCCCSTRAKVAAFIFSLLDDSVSRLVWYNAVWQSARSSSSIAFVRSDQTPPSASA